jgi:organic hydroperoxide reductase OsmC/OhrA
MAEHRASIAWAFAGGDFLRGRYSRAHAWRFDGGLTVPASPAPSVYPPPQSDPAGIDPEEAFVAAIASCHMMSFLHVAAKAGFAIERYDDDAVGTLAKDADGRRWIERVRLRPRVVYRDAGPSSAVERRLHMQAHELCFIANSVRSEVLVEAAT